VIPLRFSGITSSLCSSVIPLGDASDSADQFLLRTIFVLFRSLTQASLVPDFHKTKNPAAKAAGLIC
jgi:hypothetical protein